MEWVAKDKRRRRKPKEKWTDGVRMNMARRGLLEEVGLVENGDLWKRKTGLGLRKITAL